MRNMTCTRLAVSSVVMVVAVSSFAETRVWTGGGKGETYLNWSDPDNWQNGVPISGDSVHIITKEKKTVIADIPNLELENMIYEDGFGSSLSSTKPIRLTGTGSQINVTATQYLYAQIELAANAKLSITSSASFILQQANTFSGSGQVTVVMTGGKFNGFHANPNFTGTWHCRKGSFVVEETDGNPFGMGIVHFYGNNASEGTSASLEVNTETVFDADVQLHYTFAISTKAKCSFNGEVRMISAAGAQTFEFNNASSSLGEYVFNGDFIVDNSIGDGRPLFYNYGNPDGVKVAFLGARTQFGAKGLQVSKQNGIVGSVIHLGSPMTTQCTADFYWFYDKDHFYCDRANVFPSGVYLAVNENNKNMTDAFLDLQGYDQTIDLIWPFYSDGYTTDFSFRSTGAPATLRIGPWLNNNYPYRLMPSLDGAISLFIFKTSNPNGAYTFKGGNTTGVLASDYVPLDLTGAEFPNLGGIDVSGTAKLFVSANTVLGEDVELDLHDRSSCFVRVEKGRDVKVARVIADNVDVPAGTYCRPAMSTGIEANWMGRDNTSQDFNGTVTIAEHDPVLVWTGAAGDGLLLTAGNWGANTVPDLGNEKLTLDFRRATAQTPIVLSGMFVEPACSFSFGKYGNVVPVFAGEGTFVIGGEGVRTNGFAYTEGASLMYNGSGTLVLKNVASQTSGTLTVASGKVVLDHSAWHGRIIVAAAAELEVLSNCGPQPFGDAETDAASPKIDLCGRLTIGEGMSLVVKELEVCGKLVRRNRTYGGTGSGASCVDDGHFGGIGTMRSLAMTGTAIVVR